MEKRGKSFLFLSLAVFAVISLNFVSATPLVNTSSGLTTSYNFNEDVVFFYNISINNTDAPEVGNITQVNITLPASFTFDVGGNGTNAAQTTTFTNTTSLLSWANFTVFVINGSVKSFFWFNATAATPGYYNVSVITQNFTAAFQTNISITVNDTTAPNVAVSDLANKTYSYNQTIRVNLSVGDNGNLQACWYVLNNGANSSVACGANSTLNVSSSGTFNVTFWANDTAGNQNFTTVGFATRIAPFSVNLTVANYANRTANTRVNFSITSEGQYSPQNVSLVNVTLPTGASFITGKNASSIATSTFGNSSTNIWWNTTFNGFEWGTTNSFTFNMTPGVAGTNTIVVVASNMGGTGNQSTSTFTVNFAFAGHVKNETASNASNVNVSIYNFVQGAGGPPTEVLEASTTTNAAGYFSFASLNGSVRQWKLKMVKYGADNNCTSLNSTCNATKTGSILPPFPAMLYYPQAFSGEFDFMRPPALNGTTFYLQSASTIRMLAHNNSAIQKFGYMIMEQTTGFPVESNIMNVVNMSDIIIPTGRNYTVMFARMPVGTNAFVFNDAQCDGSFMNDSTCPSPPVSTNIHSINLTESKFTVVNQSFVVSEKRLFGCVNIQQGANNSMLNVTNIIAKLLPWTGFVPPIKGDRGEINVTADINYTGRGGCSFAFYNISVLGSTNGISYMLEIYAKNTTNVHDNSNPGATNTLAAFQNITINSTGNTVYNDTTFNVTLQRLTGSYVTEGDVNISKMKINIQNATGGAITTNMNANVKIKNPVTGTITYIIETMTNGTFYIPILNNSNWAKINVFANDAPPREITLNLTAVENNITLTTMSDGRGVGMKRINESGGMDMIDSTRLNNTMPINLRFLRNTGGDWNTNCNVLVPASDCVITSMNAKSFNPFAALVAGKINMEMKITSTNVTLMFMNFDMFSAKQPPMESIMNENASSASGSSQTWQFGSLAPVNTYEYAIIGIPYSDNASRAEFFNDSVDYINITIPELYDENWRVVWNRTRGDTTASITDDFSDYNSTSLYRNYLTAEGVVCNKTSPDLNITPCYINATSNMIYMKIPHFSGVTPNTRGSIIPVASAAAASSSGGTGGTVEGQWGTMHVITEKELLIGYMKELRNYDRVKLSVDHVEHYVGVSKITKDSATISVSSETQTATLKVGEEKNFEVSGDNYYDINVKLDSLTSSKAKVIIKYVHEAMPSTQPATTGQVTEEQPQEEPVTPQPIQPSIPIEEQQSNYIWIAAIVAVLVIVIAVFLILKKQKDKRYYHKGY